MKVRLTDDNFVISTHTFFSKHMLKTIKMFVNRHILQKPINISVSVFLIIGTFVVVLSKSYYSLDFAKNVLVEAHGMLMDIIVFGVLVYYLTQNGGIKREIKDINDEIDLYRIQQYDAIQIEFRRLTNKLISRNVKYIDLHSCYLEGIHFDFLNYRIKHLCRVEHYLLDLDNANLNNCNFFMVNMSSSSLNQCICQNADFHKANISSSSLNGANFEGSSFCDADLSGSTIINSNLANCDLRRSNFTNAILAGSNLENVKNLTLEQLLTAKSLYEVKMDPLLLEEIKRMKPSLFNATDSSLLRIYKYMSNGFQTAKSSHNC